MVSICPPPQFRWPCVGIIQISEESIHSALIYANKASLLPEKVSLDVCIDMMFYGSIFAISLELGAVY